MLNYFIKLEQLMHAIALLDVFCTENKIHGELINSLVYFLLRLYCSRAQGYLILPQPIALATSHYQLMTI